MRLPLYMLRDVRTIRWPVVPAGKRGHVRVGRLPFASLVAAEKYLRKLYHDHGVRLVRAGSNLDFRLPLKNNALDIHLVAAVSQLRDRQYGKRLNYARAFSLLE